MDVSLSPKERAQDLFSKLSKEERMAQLQNFEINLQEAKDGKVWSDYGIGFISAEWMQDCETIDEAAQLQLELQKRAMEMSPHHIPSFFYVHSIAGAHLPDATTFPSDLNRGANFNTRLEELIGMIVARQAISLGANVLVAPMMDITRDYYVERLKKTYGESRVLCVIMGLAYSKGIQKMEIEGRKALFHNDSMSIDWENSSEEYLEKRTLDVLEAKFATGLFEHPFAFTGEELHKHYYNDTDYEVTRISAEESMILLKNEDAIPLKRKMKKIAVIGPHATDVASYYLNEKAIRRNTVSLLDRLRMKRTDDEFVYARGFDYEGSDESGFEEALALIRQSDIALITLGSRYEYWNHEIGALDIQENCGRICKAQEEFIVRAHETGVPTVGIHFGVHPFASDIGAHNLDAILEALLPSEGTSDAVSDVINGKVNPGGKLPIQVYDDFDHELRIPFGYGDSFSDFRFTNVTANRTEVPAGEIVEISVNLRNAGTIAGSETIQLYLEEIIDDEGASRKLVGLRKVFFLSGESHDVVFKVSPAMVALPTYQGNWRVTPGHYSFSIGTDVHHIVGTVSVHFPDVEEVEGPERVFYSQSYVRP